MLRDVIRPVDPPPAHPSTWAWSWRRRRRRGGGERHAREQAHLRMRYMYLYAVFVWKMFGNVPPIEFERFLISTI